MVLLNLIATDVVISAFGLPLDFAAAISRGWVFGRPLCNFVGFLHTFTGFRMKKNLKSLKKMQMTYHYWRNLLNLHPVYSGIPSVLDIGLEKGNLILFLSFIFLPFIGNKKGTLDRESGLGWKLCLMVQWGHLDYLEERNFHLEMIEWG